MIQDALIPFFAVGLAELGDKTQLSILLMSSRIGRRRELLLGVMLGFLLVDGLAVLAGWLAADFVPVGVLKTFAAIIFIAFGLMALMGGESEEEDQRWDRSPFMSGFLMVSVMEFGDKTQIAAGLFATQYNPLMVLGGAIAALALLSACAVYLGKLIAGRVKRGFMNRISAAVFITMGIAFLFY
ncbi:MAG: TMEM165/GDT1 family protein [Candidatus Altiarchaeota archaeon]